jgi:hypothetical protein
MQTLKGLPCNIEHGLQLGVNAMSVQLKLSQSLALLMLAGGLFSSGAEAATFSFTSTLNGSQENPARPTLATGSATATLIGDFGANNWVFTYSGDYNNLTSDRTVNHIHNAPAGTNGPVVFDLNNGTITGTTSGLFSGSWTSATGLTDTFATSLINNGMYFNIHSTTYTSGEIRGQILAVPEPSGMLATLFLAGSGVCLKLRRKSYTSA